jgi:hypothetical protein
MRRKASTLKDKRRETQRDDGPELSRWFRLEKYRQTADFDAERWHRAITVRQICASHLRDMTDPEPIFPQWNTPVLQALESLRSNPIGGLSEESYTRPPFDACHKIWFTDVRAVRPMTFWDLCVIGRNIETIRTSGAIEEIARVAKELLLLGAIHVLYPAPPWMENALPLDCVSMNAVPLMVDFRFPNATLKDHFDLYLQELRRHQKAQPRESNRHSPDPKEWSRLQLLPCMDLLLWGQQNERKMTNSKIGRLIDLDEEQVRKTIRPLGAGLLLLPGGGLGGQVDLERIRAQATQDRIQRSQVRAQTNKKMRE